MKKASDTSAKKWGSFWRSKSFLTVNAIFFAAWWLRGAGDGLFVLHMMAVLFFFNRHERMRRGFEVSPVVLWKNTSGIRHFLANLFFNPFHRGEKRYIHEIHREFYITWFGGWIFVTFVLHAYIAVWMFIDWWDPKLSMMLALYLKYPFESLVPYWGGAGRLYRELDANGYVHRFPLMLHALVASAVGYILLILIFVGRFRVLVPQYSDYLERRRRKEIEQYASPPPGRIGMLLVAIASCMLMIAAFLFLGAYAFKFPSEYYSPRSSWLGGYGYRDNISLWGPIFMHSIFSTGIAFPLLAIGSSLYFPKKRNEI